MINPFLLILLILPQINKKALDNYQVNKKLY